MGRVPGRYMDDKHDPADETGDDKVRVWREILKKFCKYAVVVPPAMALLLTRGANAGEICVGSGDKSV